MGINPSFDFLNHSTEDFNSSPLAYSLASSKYATIKSVQNKINSLEERKGKLLDKLLDNVVSNSVYTKKTAILDNEITELRIQLEGLGDYQNDLEDYVEFGIFLLENISELYHRADVKTKQKVLSSILEEKLTFMGKKY